jgi:hypothetical protein
VIVVGVELALAIATASTMLTVPLPIESAVSAVVFTTTLLNSVRPSRVSTGTDRILRLDFIFSSFINRF